MSSSHSSHAYASSSYANSVSAVRRIKIHFSGNSAMLSSIPAVFPLAAGIEMSFSQRLYPFLKIFRGNPWDCRHAHLLLGFEV